MFSYYDFYFLCVGKAIKGTAIGLLTGVVPIYICEVFEKEKASKVLSFFQTAIPFGIFVSAVVAYCGSLSSFAPFANSLVASWALAFGPMAALIFVCPLIRDSPKDYFMFGNASIAMQLIECHSQKKDMDEREFRNYVQERSLEMMASTNSLINENDQAEVDQLGDSKKKIKLLKSFVECMRSNKVLTAVFTQCSVQLCGINAFMYYFSEICAMSNIRTEMIPMLQIALFGANFLANLAVNYYVAKVSRVMNLIYGFLVMGLCHMLLFLALQSKKSNVPTEASQADASGVLAITYCFVAVIAFSFAIAVPSLLYTTEIIPKKLSESGIPISFAFGWILNFFLSLLLPMLFKVLSAYVFTFFGAFCIVLYAVFLNLEDTYASSEVKIIDIDVDAFNEKPTSSSLNDLENDGQHFSATNGSKSSTRIRPSGAVLSVRGTIRGGITRSWTKTEDKKPTIEPRYGTRLNKLSVIGSIREPKLSSDIFESAKLATSSGNLDYQVNSIFFNSNNSSYNKSSYNNNSSFNNTVSNYDNSYNNSFSNNNYENSRANTSEQGLTQHTGFYEESLKNLKLNILSPYDDNYSKPVMRKPSNNVPEHADLNYNDYSTILNQKITDASANSQETDYGRKIV